MVLWWVGFLLYGLAVSQPTPFPHTVEVNFISPGQPGCGPEQRVDTGEGYGLRSGGYIYGWFRAGTNAPVDTMGGRKRGRAENSCEEDSVMHMQYNDCCSGNGFNGHIEWEIKLPVGQYEVNAIMGDKARNSVHALSSHTGVVIIPPRNLTRHWHFSEGSAVVHVADGRLRLSAENGGRNAKLNYVKITRVPGPTPTPAVPSTAENSPKPAPTPENSSTPAPTEPPSAGGERGPCIPNPSQLLGMSVSPLRCDLVKIDPPFHLRFDGRGFGVRDRNGRNTGFRSIIPSRYIDSYDPKLLLVKNGHLEYTTGRSHWISGRNRMINPIAVGLSVPGKKLRLSAEVEVPPRMRNGRERFCLFVAVSEKSYLALCVRNMDSSDAIHVRYEENDALVYKTGAKILLEAARTITLQLDIFPADDVVKAYYVIGSNAPKLIGEVKVQPFFLNKDQAGTDTAVGTRTHGGIYARQRTISEPTMYRVKSFDVVEIPSPVIVPGGGHVDFNIWKIHNVLNPTSMSWAPDGRLFIAQAQGSITTVRFNAARTGVTEKVQLDPIGSRLLLGIAVDFRYGQGGNDCVWLAHSDQSRTDGAANSGKITRACGPNLEDVEDVIVGLPRAIANHAVNNIEWGPDNLLYITVGSNSAAGAVNTLENSFLTRPEQKLSAAILKADVLAAGFRGDCTPSQDPLDMDSTGVANKDDPNCDVSIYASGTRNPFDLVWHRNGHLYAPDNGVGGAGSKPPLRRNWVEGQSCDDVVDGDVAIAEHDVGVREDVIYDITEGKYYGHPNPSRLQCVLGGGNPTTTGDSIVPKIPLEEGKVYSMDFKKYPAGTLPLSNYATPMASFGRNRSPDGIIAYKSSAMCNELRDELLVVYYSVEPQVHRLRLSPDGKTIVKDSILRRSTASTGAKEDLKRPLGIEQDDRGTIFVSEFGGNRVTVMNPKVSPCH